MEGRRVETACRQLLVIARRIRRGAEPEPREPARRGRQGAARVGFGDPHVPEVVRAGREEFMLADCSAAPALFYADKVLPFAASHPHAHAYLGRLMQRPSYARALKEAEPYFKFFPA